jgi:FKBP-type peptidyl-prolyl cis-trans isomerase
MKSINSILAFLFLLGMVTLSGCLETDEPFDSYAQLQKDIQAIDSYLAENSISAVKDLRGVRMAIDQLGTGLPALVENKVKVGYKGTILGGTTPFDEGVIGDTTLNSYILGWQVALTTLPAGSKATIYIPSGLGYGTNPQQGIPANSILVFEIDFRQVQLTETEKQRLKTDTTAIDNYLVQKEITDVVVDPSGLRYKITSEGTGPSPSWYTKTRLKLTYKLISDDTKVALAQTLEPHSAFDSRVVDYINGLKVILQKLKEGGKATIYVPSGLGFGSDEVRDNNNIRVIPPHSNLIVEVELLDVV